ncbi:molybdopterin molybdotransferase MoeA [Sessilibacter sp. MAH4]
MNQLIDIINNIVDTAPRISEYETVTLDQALNRVLKNAQVSSIPVPPNDNSAMDGVTINSQQQVPGEWLPISQTIFAGHPPNALTSNTAARIYTGSEIPANADAVAMQEDCEFNEDKTQVKINITLKPGENIRPQGQDIQLGEEIIPAGQRLKPQDIGLLASIGIHEIQVVRKPKVAIFSTGDELVNPGEELAPGKIYNSNQYLLIAALTALGCEVKNLGKAEDTLEATKEILQQAAKADCIITTGGVSVGDADWVKQAVSELGELKNWKLPIKPGKPLAYGIINNTPFFGLPGNPVAVFNTLLLIVKPYLFKMLGSNQPLKTRKFKTNFSHKAPSRINFLRVKFNEQGDLEKFSNQSSGVLSSVTWADGLAIVPIDKTVKSGDKLDVILLNDSIF